MSRASDRAYSHIRSMILSGELQPGLQIREEALAELCGVSRTPVRDALRRLEAELFIRRNERHIDATRLTERERDLILTLTGA